MRIHVKPNSKLLEGYTVPYFQSDLSPAVKIILWISAILCSIKLTALLLITSQSKTCFVNQKLIVQDLNYDRKNIMKLSDRSR